MNTAVPVFEDEPQAQEMFPIQQRRGVTVINQHGWALTFGVSQDRTERFLKTMALGKNHELMAAMQARKAARLRTQEERMSP